jgi:pyruvate dehydrogenase E2 component (dihydrolipoamide acetyltransferase)
MDVRLPRLGEGAESGTVINILVSEGELIQKDQTILELENEKAVAAIPSPAAGRVSKIHVKKGDEVSVNQLLISLAEEGGAEKPAPAAAAEPARAEPREPATAAPYREPKPGVLPPAPPSIRRLARDLGIDLARVRGSEAGGRITIADLRAYIQWLQQAAFAARPAAPAPRPAAPAVDFARWGPVRREKLSAIRRTIAERTTESWTTIPHVTQFDEADVTALLELRRRYAAAYREKGAHLTLTAIVLKAVVPVLKKYPAFNASLDENSQEIVYRDYYHLGVAVDTEAGLIVPVLRDVDRKDLLALSLELAAISEKARQRKLSAEELQGGTFTISNLGGIGGTHFTPIINKPQAAVLGLGQAEPRARVREGRIEPRRILPLALSYDHRLIDGADAARFVRELVARLEDFPAEEVAI